ncbi:MAG: M48 family metalloprotease [Rhodospirillales bacterium]|nr:M48 family metalloprotease [Rhodospirillales bacterium]
MAQTTGRKITRRQFTGGAMASVAAAGLSGCVTTNPATGRTSFTGLYSEKDDVDIGRREHPKLVKEFGGEYQDPALKAYIDDIGRRLAQHTELQFPYSFVILNSPIVNAFALPGGFVHITRGLLALASNEAELAGVIAHELGHVNARHTAERLSSAMLAQFGLVALGAATGSRGLMEMAQYGATAFIQGFSRQQEFEADSLGVRYISKAGYDPEAMVTFLSTLREHSQLESRMMGLPPGKVDEFNIMSTHPRTQERVQEAIRLAKVSKPQNALVGRDTYLERINGMLFGDDPEQGMIFANTFTHPGLRFRYEVPEGFRLFNSQTKVVARNADGAAITFDMGKMRNTNSMTAYLGDEWGGNLQLREIERLDINGLEAATGWNRIATRGGTVDVRLLVIRRSADQAYRLAFVTPSRLTAGLNAEFRRTTYSFRELTQEEAGKIHAMRLLVVPVRSGDTIKTLAGGMPYGRFNDDAFRVLNDLSPEQALTPGGPVKIVVS